MEEIKGYQLLESLGQGGFGTVYKAKQESTGQLTAIKILNLKSGSDDHHRRQIERFDRETQLCAKLNHPHIVRLLDKGQTKSGSSYAVFEYIPGETLKERLNRLGPISTIQTGELLGQVLDALACAHEQGIVHRDLKPHNIMLTSSGSRLNAKVLDFGIGALLPEAQQEQYKTLTMTREALGTPSYSAPEQLRGEPPSTKSDLYAWGLIFIESLTATPVITGVTLAEIYHKQLSPTEIPLPSRIAGHPLGDLLRRVLRKNPNDRSTNAKQLYSDFSKINLANIVGIPTKTEEKEVTTAQDEEGDTVTLDEATFGSSLTGERRQITTLCVELGLITTGENEPELEIIEALQRDQMSFCGDVAAKYGGFQAGSLGSFSMFHFGYPEVEDYDVQRAARTALELAGQMHRRGALLERFQGIRPIFCIGIHTGEVLIRRDNLPTGFTPNSALRLANMAEPNQILCSEATKRLLEQHIEFEPTTTLHISIQKTASPTYRMTGELLPTALQSLQGDNREAPLVGREKEFDQLTQLWRKTEKKEGHPVLIQGEAGIGKSRLTEEIRNFILSTGSICRECQSLPEYKNNALHPILEMIRHHFHLHSIDTDTAWERLKTALQKIDIPVTESLPILCSWLSLPFPENMVIQESPEEQKQKLFKILAGLLSSLKNGEPFLLLIEDLHWIDPTSLELINRLIEADRESPFFLILTARPEFSPTWKENEVLTISPEHLTFDQAETMIRQKLGGEKIAKQAMLRLFERTDGVPLFIEQLIQMLLEDGRLVQKNSVYELDDESDSGSIPTTLQDLLNARLDRLGIAKETAQIAASIGREFDYSLLVQTSLQDEATIQSSLDRILTSGLLYKQRKVDSENYIFRHALIRDAAYGSILHSDRKKTHARIAAVLEKNFTHLTEENPSEIAFHFASAMEYKRAIEYETIAAKKLLSRSANQEAMLSAEKALEWTAKLDDSVDKIDTELNLTQITASAQMVLYGWGSKEANNIRERREKLLESLKNFGETEKYNAHEELIFKNQWMFFVNLQFQSQHAKAVEIGEDVIENARRTGNRQREVTALPILTQSYNGLGNFHKTIESSKRILSIYDDEKDRSLMLEFGYDSKMMAFCTLGHGTCVTGNADSGLRHAQQGMKWTQALKHDNSMEIMSATTAMIGFFRRDPDEVKKIFEEHQKYCQRSMKDHWAASHLKIIVDWAYGENEASEKFIEVLKESGQTFPLPTYEPMIAEVDIQRGDYNKAIKRMRSCLKCAIALKENGMLPLVKRTLAIGLYKKEGSLNREAEELFLSALSIAEKNRCNWLFLDITTEFCQALINENRWEEAKSRLNHILPKIKEGHTTPLYLRAEALSKSHEAPHGPV